MLLGHVHIQLDNTCRENKNKYVTGFCAWLVSLGLCKSIRIGYLPVGYVCLLTHFKCDHCVEPSQLNRFLTLTTTSDVGERVGLVRHGWHVCGGCLSCEVSVFWL